MEHDEAQGLVGDATRDSKAVVFRKEFTRCPT
jgi:hypothetical protein